MEAPVTTHPFLELHIQVPGEQDTDPQELEKWRSELRLFVEDRLRDSLLQQGEAWVSSLEYDYFVEMEVRFDEGSIIATIKHTAASLTFVVAAFLGSPMDADGKAVALAQAHERVTEDITYFAQDLTGGRVIDKEENWSDRYEWSSYLQELEMRIQPSKASSTAVTVSNEVLTEIRVNASDAQYVFQWCVQTTSTEPFEIFLVAQEDSSEISEQAVVRIEISWDEQESEVKLPVVKKAKAPAFLERIFDCAVIASFGILIDKAVETRFEIEGRRSEEYADRLKRVSTKLAAVLLMCAAKRGLAAIGIEE